VEKNKEKNHVHHHLFLMIQKIAKKIQKIQNVKKIAKKIQMIKNVKKIAKKLQMIQNVKMNLVILEK